MSACSTAALRAQILAPSAISLGGGGGCWLGTSISNRDTDRGWGKWLRQVATKKKHRTVSETWWWTYSQSHKHCHECRKGIEAGTVYAFLPLTRSLLCEECFEQTGERAKVSERLRVRGGSDPWTPSPDEGRMLSALSEGPLTIYELSQAVRLPMGKVRGLLGHLTAHKLVIKDNDKWKLS